MANETERIAEAIRENGKIERFRIWSCGSCGRNNRVDVAKVIGLASQAKCGACGSVLKYQAAGKAKGG